MSTKYEVGKIVNTHGIKGELKVFPSTDFIEERFAPGMSLIIEHQKQEIEVTVKSTRSVKNFLLVLFEGLEDINLVEKYKSDLLYVAKENMQELEEGAYYYHEIIGLEVIDLDKDEVLGKVTEIFPTGANDVWTIEKPGRKDVLIPFLNQIVKKIDLEQNKAWVEVPEGLIDEN